VVPLRICEDLVIGVLDLDSPVENRFDAVDQEAMEALSRLLTGRVSNLLKGDYNKTKKFVLNLNKGMKKASNRRLRCNQ
jgi:hypothetical protein